MSDFAFVLGVRTGVQGGHCERGDGSRREYVKAFEEAKQSLPPDADLATLARAVLEAMERRGLVPDGTLSQVLDEISRTAGQ